MRCQSDGLENPDKFQNAEISRLRGVKTEGCRSHSSIFQEKLSVYGGQQCFRNGGPEQNVWTSTTYHTSRMNNLTDQGKAAGLAMDHMEEYQYM